MCFDLEDGFEIAVKNENGAVCIQANREGLVSLARLCIALDRSGAGNGSGCDGGQASAEAG